MNSKEGHEDVENGGVIKIKLTVKLLEEEREEKKKKGTLNSKSAEIVGVFRC